MIVANALSRFFPYSFALSKKITQFFRPTSQSFTLARESTYFGIGSEQARSCTRRLTVVDDKTKSVRKVSPGIQSQHSPTSRSTGLDRPSPRVD